MRGSASDAPNDTADCPPSPTNAARTKRVLRRRWRTPTVLERHVLGAANRIGDELHVLAATSWYAGACQVRKHLKRCVADSSPHLVTWLGPHSSCPLVLVGVRPSLVAGRVVDFLERFLYWHL